jgi:hypothetical protein
VNNYKTITHTLGLNEEVLYVNTSTSDNEIIERVMLCNTSDSPAKVFIGIGKKEDSFIKGAIYFGLVLDANESINVLDRLLLSNMCIKAYSDKANVISFIGDKKVIQ